MVLDIDYLIYMNWFVLRTKHHFEIKSSVALNLMGFQVYCPTYTQIKQYSDRKKKFIKPLLPSYIFIKIDEKNRDQVFCIPGIIKYLFWLGRPAIVTNKEIDIMKEYLSGVYDNISIKNLNIGSQYHITSGLFKGNSGKIVQISNKNLKLELKSIGISVSLKVA